MNRILFRFSVGGAIVIASAAAPLLIQRHARVQWIERQALLRQQAAQFAELSAENKRLSTLVAQMNNSCLSSAQFSELMKLRGEIGQMRKDASEAARLKSANQQVPSSSENSELQSGPALPHPPDRPGLLVEGAVDFCGIRRPANGAANGALGNGPE